MSEQSEAKETPSRHLLYFADPMCSWCWGFSPAVDEMLAATANKIEIRTVMGGLRPGTTEPMNERGKAEIRSHWEHVHDASGQPFDFAFFDRDGFVYDTEPACRAIVTARRLDPNRALDMLKSVHHAFYAENCDVTRGDELTEIAVTHGYEEGVFRDTFDDVETVTETQGDFWLSQASGVTGFPTLLAVENSQAQIVTIGYRRWDDIAPALCQWIENPPD